MGYVLLSNGDTAFLCRLPNIHSTISAVRLGRGFHSRVRFSTPASRLPRSTVWSPRKVSLGSSAFLNTE